MLLSALIVILALFAAEVGLIWQEGTGTFAYPTINKEIIELYGKGLYKNDSLLMASGFRGQDAVTAFIGCPLLIISVLLYRRGTLRGALLLAGILTYFLYVYASMALGATYNNFFLIYVALFSASLFALALTLRSVRNDSVEAAFKGGAPRRSLAVYMLASGLVTLVVWLAPLVSALVQGEVPAILDHYTTPVTFALDLAIILPLALTAAALLRRSDTRGYLVAFPLLFLIAMLMPAIIASTISQISAGVEFSTGEIVGPISGFVTLGLIAVWFIFALLRRARA
jgi:hypothetical protein